MVDGPAGGLRSLLKTDRLAHVLSNEDAPHDDEHETSDGACDLWKRQSKKKKERKKRGRVELS